MFSKIQTAFLRLINIGITEEMREDEKAKVRIDTSAILQGIVGTLLVMSLTLESSLYTLIYMIYIGVLLLSLLLVYKGKYRWMQFNLYYYSLCYLSALSLLSQGKLLIEYLIISSIIITYADFQTKKISFIHTIIGLFFFLMVTLINHYEIIDYPLPQNKGILFYVYLFLSISLLVNAMIELRHEIYTYKEDLEQKNEQLIEANLLKNKLFSIIGHDLRQPFNSIQGLLELLETENLDDETRIMIAKRIRLSNKNALTTLENLLQWGIAMQKEIALKQDLVPIYSTAQTAWEVLAETAENKQIVFKNEVNEEMSVWINKDHFELILRNLIGNAIKFSYPKSIIHLKCQTDAETKEAIVSIIDQGVGMKPEQIEKLWKKESLNSTKGTAKEKGTGLGLMLCKEFIEKNGGEMKIESKEGKGTQIDVYLKTEKEW